VNRNPYAPPDAQVADPEQPVAPLEKPRTVLIAIRLLWVSLVLSMIGAAIGWRSVLAAAGVPAGMENVAMISMVATLALTLVLSLWCIWKLNQGRNWMRIVFLLIQVFGILMYPYQNISMLGWAAGTTSLVSYLLQVAALVLVYMPASRPWFRKR
jgi:hypothetical protein